MNRKLISLSNKRKYRFQLVVVSILTAVFSVFLPHLIDGQFAIAVETIVKVEDVGPIEPIKGGEFRFGGTDRTFLIEDQWEFVRCALVLPKLPKVDFQKESLFVIMSWKKSPRSLESVHSEDDTLVVKVKQAPFPKIDADFYYPPSFLVFKLPAWRGPVRFDVNGTQRFTIVRGIALAEKSDSLWQEILRIHSGGRPTHEQVVQHYKRQYPNTPEKEIVEGLKKAEVKNRPIEPYSLYRSLFRELADTRAKPAIPRIFDLFESMGAHDKILDPAYKCVVSIGGPEAVERSKKALKSWNPYCRHAGMLVLRDFNLPETRGAVIDALADKYQPIGRCGLDILCRIGIEGSDVPAMLRALENVEAFYLAPVEEQKKVTYFSTDIGEGAIRLLGTLGPTARQALPTLQRFATNPRLVGYESVAKEAIGRIDIKSVGDVHK